MRKIITAFTLLITTAYSGFSQLSITDSSINMFYISPTYAFQVPGADMSERFGVNHDIGLTFNYKLKSNWIFGLGGTFLFGKEIREPNLMVNIINNDDYIVDINGNPAVLNIEQRGFTITGSVGKIFPWFGPNPNSGVRMELHLGYIWHHIRIRDDDDNVPQLTKEYLKGYDRMSGGFYTKQFLGYHFSSNNRKINFYAGFEIGQGFTKSLRGYNYDTGITDNKQRVDLLYGVKVGWMFMVYKRPPKEVYFH